MRGSYQTYVAGSEKPGRGRLIQHSMFVAYESFFRLGADLGQLTGAVHDAFLTAIGADPADAKWLTPGVPEDSLGAAHSGETSKSDGIAVPLSEQERHFIRAALIQWRSAATGFPLPISALGIAANWAEFDELVDRLRAAVAAQAPLSDLDWARTLFLTEIAWASDLVGTGAEFALVTSISDQDAVKLLRSIQRKIGGSYRGDLLFPNAGRPRPRL